MVNLEKNNIPILSGRLRSEPMRTILIFFCLAMVLIPGCSDSKSKATAEGMFHVKMSYSGGLKEGRNEITLTITDKNNKPVEGAIVEINPWMPEHQHGAMWTPQVSESGGGVYKSVVPLGMGGHWEFKIGISKDGAEDRVVFDFPNVPGKK
jgi:hypothetical protein